jgi:hypothetical protein
LALETFAQCLLSAFDARHLAKKQALSHWHLLGDGSPPALGAILVWPRQTLVVIEPDVGFLRIVARPADEVLWRFAFKIERCKIRPSDHRERLARQPREAIVVHQTDEPGHQLRIAE